ncbi:MAG: hypothetical protein K2X86_09480 [Cytophagaceae bacterium]|nr:hypothetical protein [Cytophagaceae bacterium]
MIIAYTKNLLEGFKIHPVIKSWKEKNLISEETYTSIGNAYKEGQHTNIFIRIALLIFTLILVSATLGLITLMVPGGDSESEIGIRLVIYSIFCFIALEIYIHTKKRYRAGIDDALLYAGLLQLSMGMIMMLDSGRSSEELTRTFTLIIFPVFAITSIRYADMLLTACAYFAMFFLIFLFLEPIGDIKLLLPFAGMIISAGLYLMIKLFNKEELLAWRDNLLILEILSLFTFYFSGNYLVVRELSIQLMGVEVSEGSDIPLAVVFYIYTVLIPLLYIGRSIQVKDRVMLRCGLIIFALAVLTFKYYYSTGHHEITLTLSGIIMVGLAWALMNYLKTQRAGFTSVKEDEHDSILNTDIEALAIAEGMGSKTPQEKFGFGDGKFGGGGGSGNF